MDAAPLPGYQAFSTEKRVSLQAEYETLIENYPDADTQYRQLFKVLCNIEEVTVYTPAVVRESAEWAGRVSDAEGKRTNFCKALSDKILFSAPYGTYTVTLNDLKFILKASKPQAKILRSQQRRKASKKSGAASDIAPPKLPRLRKMQCPPQHLPTSARP
jgi:hypothetical protein